MTPGIINRHWYKWLQTELQKLGFEAIAPSFPDEKEAKESIWISFLKNNLQVKEVNKIEILNIFEYFILE
jgi:hypothetical protein